MVSKLACNGRHWVVIQYSHSASPLRFGNQSVNLRSRQPRPIGPRCQAPLFRHHGASLLQLHPADSHAQALEPGRRTQLAGSRRVLVPCSRQHFDRAQDLLLPLIQAGHLGQVRHEVVWPKPLPHLTLGQRWRAQPKVGHASDQHQVRMCVCV